MSTIEFGLYCGSITACWAFLLVIIYKQCVKKPKVPDLKGSEIRYRRKERHGPRKQIQPPLYPLDQEISSPIDQVIDHIHDITDPDQILSETAPVSPSSSKSESDWSDFDMANDIPIDVHQN